VLCVPKEQAVTVLAAARAKKVDKGCEFVARASRPALRCETKPVVANKIMGNGRRAPS